MIRIDCRGRKALSGYDRARQRGIRRYDTCNGGMQRIRQRRSRSYILYIKYHFIGFHRPIVRALLEFIPAFPVGFPRSFLPSASVTPRNSNFRLPSLATVRILCVWGIPFALHARASHIWHVARGEGARIFNAPSTFGVGLLQKFNQQEPANSETSEFRERNVAKAHDSQVPEDHTGREYREKLDKLRVLKNVRMSIKRNYDFRKI